MADTPAGHQLLAGKTGIISGALDPNSLAWALAVAAHREGARFVLTNAPGRQPLRAARRARRAHRWQPHRLRRRHQRRRARRAHDDRHRGARRAAGLRGPLDRDGPQRPQEPAVREPQVRVVPQDAGHLGRVAAPDGPRRAREGRPRRRRLGPRDELHRRHADVLGVLRDGRRQGAARVHRALVRLPPRPPAASASTPSRRARPRRRPAAASTASTPCSTSPTRSRPSATPTPRPAPTTA